MSKSEKPFISLGNHLKYVREQAKQTLAEVSGAVEIDEKHLQKIEAGIERPEEDVLLLLINYFQVQDREAVQLWELADYGGDMPEEISNMHRDATPVTKPTIMLLAIDLRTIYSDGVEIIVNPAGVTLNFTQTTTPKQISSVAKVGMSHEQANRLISALEQAMLKAKYGSNQRLLPPPSSDKKSK